MAKYLIYPIPRKIKGPQYLELLYGNVEGIDGEGDSFELRDFSWLKMLFGRLDRSARHIVHVHWETNIYGSKYAMLSMLRMLMRFPSLLLMKLRGVKVLWTKHNMSAHDYKNPAIDRMGTEAMWRIVDTVVIQERIFANEERGKREYANVDCIPPGNYIGSYGPLWVGDRQGLRAELGIGSDEVVLLAVGSVRPYKALPKAIAAVRRAVDSGAKIRLVIAGYATDEYAEVIRREVGGSHSIILKFGYIPDDEMSRVLALADYTICYYSDSALGSAAIMLSLSYGVPVISRDFPASELIVPGIGGYVFRSDDELHSILTGLNGWEVAKAEEVMDTVRAQSWQVAGALLRKAYKRLWNS